MNDNDPVFSQESNSFQVAENAVKGTLLGKLLATDPDLDNTISYTIR